MTLPHLDTAAAPPNTGATPAAPTTAANAAFAARPPTEPTFSDPANPEQQRSARELFGSHFRTGVIVVPYTLKTRRVRQFYKRDFVFLSVMLAALDTYRHVRGIDLGLLDRAHAEVGEALLAGLDVVQLAQQRMHDLIVHAGLPQLDIRYPHAVTLEVPVVSPTARQYMDLLLGADNAFAAAEKAWLLGAIDVRMRKAEESSFRQSIRLVVAVVRSCRQRMVEHIHALPPRAPRVLPLHVVGSRPAEERSADPNSVQATDEPLRLEIAPVAPTVMTQSA
ncbi:MAG: hypothetical protein RLZZ618_3652 [Pseudomonadota bacterium]